MTMPHFLVIGAAKAGTVSLYHYLQQHPQIYMSPVNETNFFALAGLDVNAWFHGPHDREAVAQHCIHTLADYQALFAQARPDHCVGESSPLYLYSHTASAQIKQHVPQVKLIAILRQPTLRAFSNFCHYRRAGLEPLPDFAQALAAEPERIARKWGPWPFWHYQQLGFYAEQLERYYQLFDRTQIFVCLHDDLQTNPTQLWSQLFTFLGVDTSFTPDVSVKHNIGGEPRSQALYALMTRPNALKQIFNALTPMRARRWLRDRIHNANVAQPLLDTAVRQQLNRTYQADILKLQRLIGRDLSHWLEVTTP